jgi:predicted dehydrogenase
MSGGGISAARAAAEAEAEAEAAAARRLQASVPFNLGVNPSVEEASARAKVVLPFEHQGAGRHYDEGNFLAYLPRDAGGARTESGVVNKGRGHIMYVRDSDSDASAPDSDEELDEDIDI